MTTEHKIEDSFEYGTPGRIAFKHLQITQMRYGGGFMAYGLYSVDSWEGNILDDLAEEEQWVHLREPTTLIGVGDTVAEAIEDLKQRLDLRLKDGTNPGGWNLFDEYRRLLMLIQSAS